MASLSSNARPAPTRRRKPLSPLDLRLSAALESGESDQALMALRAGADARPLRNTRDNQDPWNPLAMAAWADLPECVEALLPFSEPLLPDGQGVTALMLAVTKGSERCARLLLPVSDPKQTDPWGGTVFMRACLSRSRASESHSIACAKLLLPVSDPKQQDHERATALILASEQANPELLRWLIPLSDIAAVSNLGENALMRAASRGIIENFSPLLEAGLDPDAQDIGGRNAFMLSASQGYSQCCQVLAPLTNILARDNHGFLASDHARLRGHTRLARELETLEAVARERVSLGLAVKPRETRKPAARSL